MGDRCKMSFFTETPESIEEGFEEFASVWPYTSTSGLSWTRTEFGLDPSSLVEIVGIDPRTGFNSLLMVSVQDYMDAVVVNIPAHSGGTLTFYRKVSVDAGSPVLSVLFNDGGGDVEIFSEILSGAGSYEFKTANFGVAASGGTFTFRFYDADFSIGGSAIYIDDITWSFS